MNGHDLAKPAGVDRFLGLPHQRVMAPMMAGEQRHACRFRRFHQPGRLTDIVGQRLLDQGRHARGDAFQPIHDMQLVWRRDHHPFRPGLGDHRREALEPAHALLLGQGPASGCRIDDRHQLGFGLSQHMLDVPLADHAGTHHGELDRPPDVRCHTTPPSRRSGARAGAAPAGSPASRGQRSRRRRAARRRSGAGSSRACAHWRCAPR